MARPASAKRHAQAVFDLALERDELEQWRSHLKRIAEAVEEPGLRALLESPKLALSDKRRLLSERLADISPLALNLACLLVARGRLKIAGQIAAEYDRLVDAHQGIEQAEVTSAIPLDDEEQERLSQGLGALTGARVVLSTEVDPAIVGGFMARIGDKLIDGSIRCRLEALRKSLKGRGVR